MTTMFAPVVDELDELELVEGLDKRVLSFAENDQGLELVSRAHVGASAMIVTSTTPSSSSPPQPPVLDYVTGACSAKSTMSCAVQRGIVLGLTAAGAIAAGVLSGSIVATLLGAIVGNVAGRVVNERMPGTGATCLGTDDRTKLVGRIANREITATDAETMAKSYELSGCFEDAAAIRLASKAVASGDLVAHPSDTTKSALVAQAQKLAAKRFGVIPEPLAGYVETFMGAKPGTAGQPGPSSKDVYMLQQITYRYPKDSDAIRKYLDAVAPGFLVHGLDDAADVGALTAYFKYVVDHPTGVSPMFSVDPS